MLRHKQRTEYTNLAVLYMCVFFFIRNVILNSIYYRATDIVVNVMQKSNMKI